LVFDFKYKKKRGGWEKRGSYLMSMVSCWCWWVLAACGCFEGRKGGREGGKAWA